MNLLEKAKKSMESKKETVQEVKKTEKSVKSFKNLTEKKHKKPKMVEIPKINKSIELNSIKTLYANRFGSTTNMLKADMQKALIKKWNEENKKGVDK